MLEAIKQDRRALEYASAKLNKNPDFISSVLEEGIDSISFIPEELRENRDFMIDVVSRVDFDQIQDVPETLQELLEDNNFMYDMEKRKEEIEKSQEKDKLILKLQKENAELKSRIEEIEKILAKSDKYNENQEEAKTNEEL